MDIEQIMAAIRSLAESLGYYGRLYNELREMQTNDTKKWEDVKNALESQHFKDSLDMVLFFET